MGSIDNHLNIAAVLRPTLKRVSGDKKLSIAGEFICGDAWAIHKDIAPPFLRNIYRELPDHGDPTDVLAKLELVKQQQLTVTDTVRIFSGRLPGVMLVGNNREDTIYVNAYFLGLFAADTPELFRVSWANVGVFNDTGDVVGIIARIRVGLE